MLGILPECPDSVICVEYVLPFEDYIPPHKVGGDDLACIECFSLILSG